jgi:hypothetical protein
MLQILSINFYDQCTRMNKKHLMSYMLSMESEHLFCFIIIEPVNHLNFIKRGTRMTAIPLETFSPS